MTQLKFRDATLDDVPQIAALQNAALLYDVHDVRVRGVRPLRVPRDPLVYYERVLR